MANTANELGIMEVAMEDIREDILGQEPGFLDEDPDFSRCIWDGQRMVTEEEYEMELAEYAV